jgi:hypothetical protein
MSRDDTTNEVRPRTLLERLVRSEASRAQMPPRRARVGVEALEDRVSLSGFAAQPGGTIYGVEDPNQRTAILVSSFNP